jgi:hypothetical protein
MSLIALAAAIAIHTKAGDPSVEASGWGPLTGITRDFDIPAQPLGHAMIEYGRQSGRQLLFDVDDIGELRLTSVPVRGHMSIVEAGRQLLAGNLRVVFVVINPNTLAVVVQPPPRQLNLIHKAIPKDEPTPHECVCAQSREGIPLGPWCWEGDELHHVPACRAPTP